MTDKTDVEEFLEIAGEFKLGELDTEGFHEKSSNLSFLSKNNLKKAFSVFKEIDVNYLRIINLRMDQLLELNKKVWDNLETKKKVFLSGCGATGRLSIALESIFNRMHPEYKGQVVSFMAGGDYALIKSIENFEDKMEFGRRQIKELGFDKNDLLMAITEGGETSFVIATAEYAAEYSTNNPYFLYCNKDEVLGQVAKRSKNVLDNDEIIKVNLANGPQALSGSTRLQASSVQMLFAGLALYKRFDSIEELESTFNYFIDEFKKVDFTQMQPLTTLEHSVYENNGLTIYNVKADLGISILTDTTERSPTFNLNPFENFEGADEIHSLTYLMVEDAKNSEEAWKMILDRNPRTLNWEECPNIDEEVLYGFDISQSSMFKRRKYEKLVHIIDIKIIDNTLNIFMNSERIQIQSKLLSDELFKNLVVKMLLNAHSTLLMGRLDRYKDNVMTWVKPSNFKLIDRAARYCLLLLSKKNIDVDYEEVVRKIYELKDISSSESIVLKVVEALS